jgi:hypothetical protein
VGVHVSDGGAAASLSGNWMRHVTRNLVTAINNFR